MTIQYPRCGADRPAAAAFCSRCGAKMTQSASAQADRKSPSGHPSSSSASGAPAPPAPTPPSPSRKIGGWIGAAAVLLIGGGLRQIGLTAAHNPHQAASLLQNPFGPHPLASGLRQFQRGDSWEYRVRRFFLGL